MDNDKNLQVLTAILAVLKDLDPETQRRTLLAVITFLDIPIGIQDTRWKNPQQSFDSDNSQLSKKDLSFTEDRDISAKDFIRDKAPRLDIERIACLAYYLTHYKQKPHFKTLDLSTLNTEAAQPKFSNAAQAVDNATKSGLLVPAIKGTKQLSAAGELYVQALPDREAARQALKSTRIRKKTRKPGNSKNILNKTSDSE